MPDQNDSLPAAQAGTTIQASTVSLPTRISDIRDTLENLDETNIAGLDDTSLVELRNEIKNLEDTVSETRSDVVDSELEQRIDVGDSLLGLSHIESHNKYVAEDEGAVIMRAVSRGVDYTKFVDLNASTLASDFPDLAEISRAEYTYLR